MAKDSLGKKKDQFFDDIMDGDKLKKRSQAIINDMSYGVGSVSRKAADQLKKMTEASTYKKLGKGMGVFQEDVETGWRRPEKVIKKDAITIKDNSVGIIIGSFARCTAEELKKAGELTVSLLGKGYKKGRIAMLVKMWKLEHPGSTKTEQETAIKKIEELYKA